jgi:hypothetical protein
MARSVVSYVPADPILFGPMQLRPRAVLGECISGLSRWLVTHLVSYPKLLGAEHTSMVAASVRLDYALPDLAFADADWLVVTTSVVASQSGQWLRVITDVSADGAPAARVELHARVVNLDGDAGLSAQTGAMPGHLLNRFASDERFTDDPRSLIRAAVPPQLGEALGPDVRLRMPLLRSHADVADQWSFIEMAELLTQARERAYLDGSLAGVVAAGSSVRSLSMVLKRALFVFDECTLTMSPYATTLAGSTGVIGYTLVGPHSGAPCLSAWELLGKPATTRGEALVADAPCDPSALAFG